MIEKVNQSTGKVKFINVHYTLHLREIAFICIPIQFIAAIIYLAFSLIFPGSHFVAVICGLLAIFVSLVPVYYAVSKNCIILLLSSICVFNIAPIWFLYLEAVLPGYDAFVYSAPVYRMEAFFWVAIFQILINLLYMLFWKKINLSTNNFFSFLTRVSFSAKFYSVLCIFSFCFSLLAFFFYYGSGEIMWDAITAGRADGNSGGLLMQSSIGDNSSFMLPILWLWQLTPLFGAIAFISFRKKGSFLAIFNVFLGALVILVSFLGGTRAAMIFSATPFLFFIFYYNIDNWIKFWLIVITIFFASIAIMEFQLRFRNEPLLEVISNPIEAAKVKGLKSFTTFDPTESHRDNNMYLFCLIVKYYPDKYSFHGFDDLYVNMVNPIPRALWPDKPVIQGVKDLAHQYKFVVNGPLKMGTTSLTYSIVGEAYMAGGLWGLVIYSIIYAFILLLFDGVVNYADYKYPLSVGILSMTVFLAFWSYRALFSLTSYIYPLILFIILLSLFTAFKR